jgi:hypothetical protein
MIWHTNVSRPQECWSIYRMHMIVQIWSENTAVQIYFKNNFIFGLGFYFWRKKSKSQKTVHEYFGKVGTVCSFGLRWSPRFRQSSHPECTWLSIRQDIFENLWIQNRLNWRVSYSYWVWFGVRVYRSLNWNYHYLSSYFKIIFILI